MVITSDLAEMVIALLHMVNEWVEGNDSNTCLRLLDQPVNLFFGKLDSIHNRMLPILLEHA